MMHRLLVTFDVEELDWGRPRADAAGWSPTEPSARGLEAVLPVLAERAAPATFFCTGRFAQERPELVRRLRVEGHEVASHGLDHRDDYRRLDLDTAASRLTASRHLLEDLTGASVRGVRTPRLAPCPATVVAAAGFAYDASPQPTWVRGRNLAGVRRPRSPWREAGVVQVPLSVLPVLRLPVAWYVLRAFGDRTTASLARLAGSGVPWVHLYFHPWEAADLRAQLAPHPLAWGTGPRWVEALRGLLGRLAGSLPPSTVDAAVQAWAAARPSTAG